MSNSDTRLMAVIEGDEVVIRVKIDALVFATENHNIYHPDMRRPGEPLIKVTDKSAWMKSFVDSCNNEAEDGSTLIMRALDDAIEYAVEQGLEGVDEVAP